MKAKGLQEYTYYVQNSKMKCWIKSSVRCLVFYSSISNKLCLLGENNLSQSTHMQLFPDSDTAQRQRRIRFAKTITNARKAQLIKVGYSISSPSRTGSSRFLAWLLRYQFLRCVAPFPTPPNKCTLTSVLNAIFRRLRSTAKGISDGQSCDRRFISLWRVVVCSWQRFRLFCLFCSVTAFTDVCGSTCYYLPKCSAPIQKKWMNMCMGTHKMQ